jgi:hypothetical protein
LSGISPLVDTGGEEFVMEPSTWCFFPQFPLCGQDIAAEEAEDKVSQCWVNIAKGTEERQKNRKLNAYNRATHLNRLVKQSESGMRIE